MNSNKRAKLTSLTRQLFDKIEAEVGSEEARRIWRKAMDRRGRKAGSSAYHYDNIALVVDGVRSLAAVMGWSDAKVARIAADIIAPDTKFAEFGGQFLRPPTNRNKRAERPSKQALLKAISRAMSRPLPVSPPIERGEPGTLPTAVISLLPWPPDSK